MSTSKEWFGNLDKKQEFPLDPQYADNPHKVVGRQQYQQFISGRLQTMDHNIPIKAYSIPLYEEMSAQGENGKTPFQEQNLIFTPLHDPRIKEKAKAEPESKK